MADALDDRSSEHLARQTASGDLPALEILLARHLPRLVAWVRLRAGDLVLDRESAHDIAQSACREVLEHIDRFQFGGEAGFRHWLYETALRKIRRRHAHWLAQRRDVGRERSIREDSNAAGSRADGAFDPFRDLTSPSEGAIAHEIVDRMSAVFRTLPEPQQEAVALSRIVGMSNTEVAETMGINEATARSHLHRGLARLAEALVDDDDRSEGGRDGNIG